MLVHKCCGYQPSCVSYRDFFADESYNKLNVDSNASNENKSFEDKMDTALSKKFGDYGYLSFLLLFYKFNNMFCCYYSLQFYDMFCCYYSYHDSNFSISVNRSDLATKLLPR